MNKKNNKSTTNMCGNKNTNNSNYKILTITIMIIKVITTINSSNL